MSKIKRQETLTTMESPSYLLNFPSSFSTKEPNNVWMTDSSPEELVVDREGMFAQWFDLYNIMAANAFVQVLPTPKDCDLQDLVFVANLGIVLSHIKDRDVVIISNFTSKPRRGETQVGVNFFKIAGYEVYECPFKWEGEADLKYISGNTYVGGYGIRSTLEAYDWMEQKFDMKIIRVKMNNLKLYHFDCSFFPITDKDALVATSEMTAKEIGELSEIVNIIPVEKEFAEMGATNNIRLHNIILAASDLMEMDPILDSEWYYLERDKNQFLEDVLVEFGFEINFINISEFSKGGASLSCLCFHMNRNSYNYELV